MRNGPARINMRTATGNQTASLAHGRRWDSGRWSLTISSDDPLMDGYDEVTMVLDDQSIRRLVAFLKSGLDPVRDADLPDLPDWTLSNDRPEPRRLTFGKGDA